MRLSILTKLLFFVPLLSLAADEFTVYYPKHRSTEELVNLGASTFGDKANFSSLGGKVVINASPKTTASVLKLFSQLDQVARQFKISFRLVKKAEIDRNSISFKDGKVTLGKRVSAEATIGAEREQKADRSDSVQSAWLLEGAEAQMALGNNWLPGGFTAKARGGAGEMVTLEFKQREGSVDPAFSLQSEVLVKLGEWKTVGEISQSSVSAEAGMLGQGSNSSAQKKNLQVKLEREK